MGRTRDIWVYVECVADGAPKSVGLELLSEGRILADKLGGRLTAVVIGRDTDRAAAESAECGADTVIAVEGAEYSIYNTESIPA